MLSATYDYRIKRKEQDYRFGLEREEQKHNQEMEKSKQDQRKWRWKLLCVIQGCGSLPRGEQTVLS